jgi:hypothetical protein
MKKLITLLILAITLFGCELMNQGDPYYPNNYPYPNQYPPHYGGYGYPPPPPPQYPYGYPPRRPYYDDDHRHDHRNDNDRKPQKPQRPAQTIDSTIKPSCPSGTTFNGQHCIINDPSLKRKGGDGKINPCPKGMWVSGGRCIGS